MGIVTTVFGNLDTAIQAAQDSAFTSMWIKAYPLFNGLAVVAVVLVGMNLWTQTIRMDLRNGLSLGVRIVVINALLTGTMDFMTIYNAITNAPSTIGGLIMNAVTSGGAGDPSASIYGGIDQIFTNFISVGNNMVANGGYIVGGLGSLALFAVGIIMAAMCIIIICSAKIMVGAMVFVAPFALASTMTQPTKWLFDNWLKLTMSAAMVPLVASALLGFVLVLYQNLVGPNLSTITSIGAAVNLILVGVIAIFLLSDVPTYAQTLGGAAIGLSGIARNTTAVGLGAAAGAAGGAAIGAAGTTGAIAGTANWASGGRLADAASSVSGATITASKAAQAYLGATPAAQGANAAIKALRNSKKSQA